MGKFIELNQTGVLETRRGLGGGYNPEVLPFLEGDAVYEINRIVNTDAIIAVWVEPVRKKTCVSFVNTSAFSRDVWVVSNPYEHLRVELGVSKR